jgi:UDP-glucose 4-epimerase
MSKKCIVIGGAGFIGSHVADSLVDKGYSVRIIDDLSTGNLDNVNHAAEFVEADISEDGVEDTLATYFDGADYVFHLAAMARVQPSIEDPVRYDQVNVGGTLRMLKLAADHNIEKFVFSSSSSVYGEPEYTPTDEEHPKNPMSPYAANKLIGEVYCKMFSEVYDLPTVCLRYFNVYGERQPLEGAYALVMGIFADQLLKGNPMTINGDGEQRRDFTYVKDVVNANILAAESDDAGYGESYNVGNNDNRSVNQLADLLGGDRVTADPVIEPRVTLANNDKISKALGWKPTVVLDEWVPGWKKSIGL